MFSGIKFYIATVFLLISISSSIRAKEVSSESIGFYTAGCVRNSAKLQESGDGYQVIRLSRQRNYGHPSLVKFIEYIGQQARAKLNSSLFIGDMSIEKGGPLPSDHNSHQTGLDTDIMYLNHDTGGAMLSIAKREDINPISVLTSFKKSIKKNMWSNKQTGVLILASSYPAVDRIFVNPVIKKELCEKHRNQPWLEKIRPWYGHDGHFHVRLGCPEGSPKCENQKPVMPGDGCGDDLKQWFIPKDETITVTPEPKKIYTMPEQCIEILSGS